MYIVIVKTLAKIRLHCWLAGVVNVLMCNVVCNLITRVLCLLLLTQTITPDNIYSPAPVNPN